MATRRKIGIIYKYNENWIGGTYYILNLINALNYTEDHLKPVIVVIADTREEYEDLVKQTKYPYTILMHRYKKLSLLKRVCNKFYRLLFNRLLFSDTINVKFPVFPVSYVDAFFKEFARKIYWIPDFQEHHLPEFFTKEDIDKRLQWQSEIQKEKGAVVFSSHDAKSDFNRLYPFSTLNQFVVPFAVTHPSYQELDFGDLVKKFGIPETYFFSPNQFWVHKNHIVILKAIQLLKSRGISISVVFTGKEHDYRYPGYYDFLKEYIHKYDISNHVYFLGFIDRREQLKLMSNALAVIQPSKCEGWSTVIEDVKAMNQYVIASDINVHKEQLDSNCAFFNPDDESGLAGLLENIMQSKAVLSSLDYSEKQKKFAKLFLEMIDSVN
jgi:glycosyltransferase involved in cell wall biosynthesis